MVAMVGQQHFDELAKGLVTNRLTRRRVLKSLELASIGE
jgi:hypothetical protein